MKIGITYRLFFSILGATCLTILAMSLIMVWSINRGFYQYLGAIEEGILENMAGRLEQAYSEHGTWEFLKSSADPGIGQLLAESFDKAMTERPGKFEEKLILPPFRFGNGAQPARLPLVILDAERKPIIGSSSVQDELNLRPLLHQGRTVGYLGLLPPKQFLHPVQVQFLSQQKLSLALAAGGLLIVVALVSLPLAKRLVRPIKAIAAATGDLASGKYSVRVPVTSSDELGQLGRDFNSMALTLEKHEKDRRQWVADISHELRTPVAVLRGEIEALIDGVRTVTPDTIRSLHAETLRLGRLVEDLYQLSLSDLGALTYKKEDLELSEALRDSIESHSTEFQRKGITVTGPLLDGPGVIVHADGQRLDQLFANLLENTLRYTAAGGTLVVSLKTNGEQAVIELQDTAPGVPEKDLERLFERFYRVEGSRSRASGGAGLGLAICRNIVEAHEGTISAHPSPLGGLLIRITFPVGRSA